MIIFDYSILADDSHRRHFIDPYFNIDVMWWSDQECFSSECDCGNWVKDNLPWQPDYAAYYAQADKDVPITSSIHIFDKLMWLPNNLLIWCDHPLINEIVIRKWTNKWVVYPPAIHLKMRPDGDTTPWHELKEKWIQDHLSPAKCENSGIVYSKVNIEMAFERAGSPMIEVWKKYGVPVMEVHI